MRRVITVRQGDGGRLGDAGVVLFRVPLITLLLATSPAALGVACGGAQAGRGGATTGEASPVTSTSPESAAPSPEVGSTVPTTTSATLGDAGDGRGAKLPETGALASSSPGAAPAPTGPHTHDPGRGPGDIRAIVSAHADETHACYDRALKAHPGIEGSLAMTFTIDPKGNVIQTSVDSARSEITEAAVVDCIAAIVKKLQFAASPGGFETKASYPFKFYPRHVKPAQ